MERISDEWLATMFQNQVGWVLRKEVCPCEPALDMNTLLTKIKWDSYPVLPPTRTFPPMKLDDGLFYVNSFEPYVP